LSGAAEEFFKKKLAPNDIIALGAGEDGVDGGDICDGPSSDDDDEVDGVFSKSVPRKTLLEAERLVLSGKDCSTWDNFVVAVPMNKQINC